MTIDELEPLREQTIEVNGEEILIRSIDDLVRLDSYQDMNDYEIKKLMDYKSANAVIEANLAANEELYHERTEEILTQSQAAAEAAQAAYEQALSVQAQFQAVES